MKPYKVNQEIQWNWMGCQISGTVKETFTDPITKLIKSKKIKRNASSENPAYLVESQAGNLALKLHSELLPASSSTDKKGPAPKLFRED